MELTSFDEVVSNFSYARKRFSISQDHLLVGLWGFFERAAAGLTRLYKDKLDNCSDNQCLIETLHLIDSFYRISQDVLNCAQKQGSAIGYDCQRLVLRDLLLPAENTTSFQKEKEIEKLHGYEVYSSVLGCNEGSLSGRPLKRHRHSHHNQKLKHGGRPHCRRCCHRRGKARRPPVKRCRLPDDADDQEIKKEMEKVVEKGYDFSQASKDLPNYGVVDFSPCCPAFAPVPNFGIKTASITSPCSPSATVTKLLQEAGVVLSPGDHHRLQNHEGVFRHHDNLFLSLPPPSSRKRLFDLTSCCDDTDTAFIDAVHLSNLISPLSKFSLDPSVPPVTKRHRLDSSTCNPAPQELPRRDP